MQKKRSLKFLATSSSISSKKIAQKIPVAPTTIKAIEQTNKPVTIQPEIKKVKKPSAIPIKLEKVEPISSNHSLSIKKYLLSLDPTLPLIDEVLPDHPVKERMKKGTCPYAIALLAFEKNPQKISFLKNLEKSLQVEFMPTKLYNASIIEKEDRWDSFLSSKDLKLIIATDHEIFHAKNLMKLYKELPSQSKRMIKDIALFLLPDLNLYFKQPVLKRSLYKALCHKIKAL